MRTALVEEHLIEASRAGFVDAWKLMAGLRPEGAIDEFDGLALAVTGLDIASCNPAMALRPPKDPPAALDYARRFYERHGVPWVFFAAGDALHALAPAARELGMRRAGSEPAMFLDRQAAREVPPPEGLTIQTVRDDATMEVYRNAAGEGFGVTPESLAIWANPRLVDTPGLRFYLGSLDGRPVATSCVYVLHGIATVNMVSTIPEFRRRGIGEAMVARAIHDGVSLGGGAVFLHATKMGFPTYQRMGFKHAFTYEIWSS